MSKTRLLSAPPTWDDTLRRGMQCFDRAAHVKYLCRVCRHYLYSPEFSIHGIRRGSDGHLLEQICNTCKMKKTRGMFLKRDASPDWQKDAACAGMDESTAELTFFPTDTEKLRERRWEPICADCPVRAQCEAYGRQTLSYGVWGGVLLYEGVEQKTGPQVENLLRAGKCVRGHPILSRDDMTIRTNNVTGYTTGECKKCISDNRRARKENKAKSVMLAA
jgi:WhiB family transcriptional regulator, redox-sensing transcriptional regulator